MSSRAFDLDFLGCIDIYRTVRNEITQFQNVEYLFDRSSAAEQTTIFQNNQRKGERERDVSKY